MGMYQAVFTCYLLMTWFCGADALRLWKDKEMPIEENSLRLSCSYEPHNDDLFFFCLRNTNTSAECCSLVTSPFCYPYSSSYKLTFSKPVIHLNIIRLNRERDEGHWECFYLHNEEVYQAELNIIVYTLPRGLLLSQGGDVKVDFSQNSLTIECETDGCTYPAPEFRWYFKDMTQSSPRRLYNGSNTHKIETERGCIFPEQIYTSFLHIPFNSWWPENKVKTVVFSCGVEYPESSRNIVSTDSENITFAVAVTSVYINGSTWPVVFYKRLSNSLTCSSSPSNPIATIRWWLDYVPMNDSIVVTNTLNVEELYTTIRRHLSIRKALGEKKDQSDHVVVTIPELIAIGAAPAAFSVTIIAIVIVFSKRRRSLAKRQNCNMSEEDQVHGNDTSRNDTRTADSNDIPNEYERLRRIVEEENKYIRLQGLSESNQDMGTRNETLIKEIWTVDNNDSPDDHEGLRSNVDEDIRFKGIHNISESNQDMDTRHETLIKEIWTAANNDIPNKYEWLRRNVEEENTYIRLQNLSESSQDMDTRNETRVKEILTADNKDSPNDHEGLRRDVDEDIPFIGMQNISESSQAINARNQTRGMETWTDNNKDISIDYVRLRRNVDEDIPFIGMQNLSESSQHMDKRNETRGMVTWTADNTDIPNEYERLRRNVDEDIPFIGMQNLPQSSQDMDPRIETRGMETWTADNKNIYNEYESLRCNADEDFPCIEVQSLSESSHDMNTSCDYWGDNSEVFTYKLPTSKENTVSQMHSEAIIKPETVKHHPVLPSSIRIIMIVPSGSGKTHLLIDMIMIWMKWHKLYLVAPSVDDQRCYQVLKYFNERILEMTGENGIEFITDIDETPSVDDLKGEINNLVAYDNVMLDKQTNPSIIFSRGRHKNADVIYVTQRYTLIPKVIEITGICYVCLTALIHIR